MKIEFTKLSAHRHGLTITRSDGTGESVELESRSMLRHDLAHLAVESQIPLRRGFWGHIARGTPLTGDGIDGAEAELAEALAGPTQTLMRRAADSAQYRQLLDRVAPQLANDELAARICEHIRQLRGHWQATPYGGVMELAWSERPDE